MAHDDGYEVGISSLARHELLRNWPIDANINPYVPHEIRKEDRNRPLFPTSHGTKRREKTFDLNIIIMISHQRYVPPLEIQAMINWVEHVHRTAILFAIYFSVPNIKWTTNLNSTEIAWSPHPPDIHRNTESTQIG